MLDRLRGGEEAGIKGRRALVLLHDLRTFVGDADDGVARLALGLLVDGRKHLLEASELLFGLSFVLLNAALSSSLCAAFAIFGSVHQVFLLCVINILQSVMEQVVKFLGFLRHQVLRC